MPSRFLCLSLPARPPMSCPGPFLPFTAVAPSRSQVRPRSREKNISLSRALAPFLRTCLTCKTASVTGPRLAKTPEQGIVKLRPQFPGAARAWPSHGSRSVTGFWLAEMRAAFFFFSRTRASTCSDDCVAPSRSLAPPFSDERANSRRRREPMLTSSNTAPSAPVIPRRPSRTEDNAILMRRR
jgi:hypothetical protein